MADVRLRVTVETGEAFDDPDETRIQRLYAGLNLRCRFLIMERPAERDDGQTYIQLALNDDLTMVIEHREGGPEAHYRAEVHLPAEHGGDELVAPVLLGWAAGRSGWRGALNWVHWDTVREAPWSDLRD
ncbi:hypothetical protein [Streptomyces sp. NPDC060187]|uniref:hypothetical protein n=1 Tax=Streptomyces sp. NPDC060187 TaxID=3347067 RepID=UPI0036629D03